MKNQTVTGALILLAICFADAQIVFNTTWSKNVGSIENAEISPDGSMCALGITGQGVKIVKSSDYSTVKTIQAYTDACSQEKCKEIECLSWSNDGKYIATGGNSRPITIWDFATGKSVFTKSSKETDGLRASPSGKFFAIADHSNILVITIPDWKVTSYGAHSCGINSVDFTPDGKYMVTGACDKKAILWEVSGTTITKKLTVTNPGSVKTVRITRDGKYFICSCAASEKVVIWDNTGKKIKEVSVPGYVDHAELSPDGSVFVCQGKSTDVRVYSMPGGNEIKKFNRGGNGEYMHWRGNQLLIVGGVATLYKTTGLSTGLAPDMHIMDNASRPEAATPRIVCSFGKNNPVGNAYSLTGEKIAATGNRPTRALTIIVP